MVKNQQLLTISLNVLWLTFYRHTQNITVNQEKGQMSFNCHFVDIF